MKYTYRTKGVCAMSISFDLEGNVVRDVSFMGGCNGNLKAISKLVDGMTVEEIESKLKGNRCGFKPTSCADQLAIAVRTYYEENK
ncbi:MAG: TIGR03905 family TSCPD domain-containing protein [Clostridia bacterium]|nr:TIGR03905 family TSCPD domain-containing protein [Clostridia bacterium]MBR3685224.1 TIGR03905 family TSCPD domain-containing protein [Clostridia bacterium]